METIVGFAIGYAVGVREGRAGFERLLASCRALAGSAELRRLAGTAAAAALPIARQLASGGAAELVGRTAERLIEMVGGAPGGAAKPVRAA